jgi:hypothetical protein
VRWQKLTDCRFDGGHTVRDGARIYKEDLISQSAAGLFVDSFET